MRDRYDLKTEIDSAQEDLEKNLHELREVIAEKVDVKGKVMDKVDEKKDMLMDYAVRGRQIALDVVHRARTLIKERPVVIIGAVGGLLLVGGLIMKIRGELSEDDLDVFDPRAGRGLPREFELGERKYVLVEVG